MINQMEARKNYLKKLGIPYEKWDEYLAVMDKYEFDWWETKDFEVLVKFQLNEPKPLIPTDFLQYALRQVLKRPVSYEEVSFHNTALKEEVLATISS